MSLDDLNVKFQTLDIEITVDAALGGNIDVEPDVIVILAANVGPPGVAGSGGSSTPVGIVDEEFAVWDITTSTWIRSTLSTIKIASSGMLFGADVNLYRAAANQLKTDDLFITALGVHAHGGADPTYLVGYSGNRVFQIRNTGIMEWGPGGTDAVDTNLYRNGADRLKTDDKFVAGAGVEFPDGSLQTTAAAPSTALIIALGG